MRIATNRVPARVPFSACCHAYVHVVLRCLFSPCPLVLPASESAPQYAVASSKSVKGGGDSGYQVLDPDPHRVSTASTRAAGAPGTYDRLQYVTGSAVYASPRENETDLDVV